MQIPFLRLTGPAAETAREIPPSAGMLFACWAIVIVLAAMFVVFMRAKKKEYAVAILPLGLEPFVHIFSRLFANWLDPFLPLTAPEIRVAVDLTAALIACLIAGWTSRLIRGKRTRTAFLLSCSGFIIILTLVLVVHTLMEARI